MRRIDKIFLLDELPRRVEVLIAQDGGCRKERYEQGQMAPSGSRQGIVEKGSIPGHESVVADTASDGLV